MEIYRLERDRFPFPLVIVSWRLSLTAMTWQAGFPSISGFRWTASEEFGSWFCVQLEEVIASDFNQLFDCKNELGFGQALARSATRELGKKQA